MPRTLHAQYPAESLSFLSLQLCLARKFARLSGLLFFIVMLRSPNPTTFSLPLLHALTINFLACQLGARCGLLHFIRDLSTVFILALGVGRIAAYLYIRANRPFLVSAPWDGLQRRAQPHLFVHSRSRATLLRTRVKNYFKINYLLGAENQPTYHPLVRIQAVRPLVGRLIFSAQKVVFLRKK